MDKCKHGKKGGFCCACRYGTYGKNNRVSRGDRDITVYELGYLMSKEREGKRFLDGNNQ